MNLRQRVLCALNHQEPDRVPIDLGGTRQSGIAASTYHKLKQRLGITTPTRVYDVYQMLAEVERPVLERFGADVVGLQRAAVALGICNENWRTCGGYVLASVHNIQAGVPPENVIALFDTALSAGVYSR